MIAIISDIHANLEALQAVLADIDAQQIRTLFCLGDVIGYGPNPRECLDLVMSRAELTILGNHDQAALFDPVGFTAVAERAVFWTRRELESSPEPASVRERRWEWLSDRPRMVTREGRNYVHGSARNPLNEYVFPEDAHHHSKMRQLFALTAQVTFQGHTHIPGVFVEDGQRGFVYHHPTEMPSGYDLRAGKALVNVGSVGQPRDGDPRACYVVVEGEAIQFRRVDYNREATISKMLSIPDLDPFLSHRLRRGQ